VGLFLEITGTIIASVFLIYVVSNSNETAAAPTLPLGSVLDLSKFEFIAPLTTSSFDLHVLPKGEILLGVKRTRMADAPNVKISNGSIHLRKAIPLSGLDTNQKVTVRIHKKDDLVKLGFPTNVIISMHFKLKTVCDLYFSKTNSLKQLSQTKIVLKILAWRWKRLSRK
jgi:hypothetical protein